MIDNWSNRDKERQCRTCMYYVEKIARSSRTVRTTIGRCKRKAPTSNGFPMVYPNDGCGEQRIDENKI